MISFSSRVWLCSQCAVGTRPGADATNTATVPAIGVLIGGLIAFSTILLQLLFSAIPASAAPGDADAHIKLTDGARASGSTDPAWLSLVADADQLPKTNYSVGEWSFWGLNAPHGFSPGRTPAQFDLVKQANIRGVRYDVMWGGVQQNGPTTMSYNWGGAEDDINAYVQNGFTVSALMGFTPGWANGLRHRAYPPNKPVEKHLVTFTTDTRPLQKPYVIVAEQEAMPFAVTPDPVPYRRNQSEVITTNFTTGLQPKTMYAPVIYGTEQVWVDEKDGRGFRLWTRVEHLIQSPDGAEHYEFDRSGRVKFRDNSIFWYHGRTPRTGSSVKITYDSITKTYDKDVDYTVDHINGTISRVTGSIPIGIGQEDFNGPTLNAQWSWVNPPAAYNVGTTKAGHLWYKVNAPQTGPGHILAQTLPSSGDFSASVRFTKAPTAAPFAETGIAVYQDNNNWFRYAMSTNAGRPLLTQCVNGQITVHGLNGELGFQIFAPRWITVRKLGTTYTVFTSNSSLTGPDGGYQLSYSFQRNLNFPLKVGLVSAGTDTVGTEVDQFLLKSPTIQPGGKVNVFYNYMDPKPFTDFCKLFVEHFKDRVKYWEIVNEPDQGWCWRGGMDLYAIMLREASIAIKSVDPEAKIVSGGYANGAAGNLNWVYNTIGSSHFDVAAWHPYLFSNKSPDTTNWAYGGTNGQGRTVMLNNNDSDKEVFLGEMASASGVTASGGGMNDWKQAEYGMRLFMLAKRLGYVKGIQWWPGVDLNEVGDAEDNKNGGHEGIFYLHNSEPKPIYWSFRNAATNKGVLLDLASYDSDNVMTPASGYYPIRQVIVGVQNISSVASITVHASVTGTDATSRPDRVAARHIGQAGANPIAVTVDRNLAALKHESWTATALTPLSFTVEGSKSGVQGVAVPGIQFRSLNGVASFTIPTGAYAFGDKFVFETFAGDGFTQVGLWQSTGLQQPGNITVDLLPTNARYVSIRIKRAAGASSVNIDEVQVIDSAGQNVASGKLYLVDGYQPETSQPEGNVSLGEMSSLPDGSEVIYNGKVVHLVRTGVAYVQEADRASGIRLEGNLAMGEDNVVNFMGTLRTSPGGERYVQVSTSSVTGQSDCATLTVSNDQVQKRMLDGLCVRIYGKVLPGTITSNSFRVSDGYDPDPGDGVGPQGVLIYTNITPTVTAGEFVTVTGAAGWDNGRTIHKR